MIKRIQLGIFFLFGFASWNGVSSLVAEAKTEQFARLANIMTIEQLVELPASEL